MIPVYQCAYLHMWHENQPVGLAGMDSSTAIAAGITNSTVSTAPSALAPAASPSLLSAAVDASSFGASAAFSPC